MVHNLLPTFVTGAALTIAMSEIAFFFVYRSRRRTRELERSAELFRQYFDLSDILLGDERVPAQLKEFIEKSLDLLPDRAFARVVTADCENDPPDPDPEFAKVVRAFNAAHPDLFDDVVRCVRMGLYAGLLRWPETSDKASYVISKVISASGQQIVTNVVRREGRHPKAPQKRPALVPAE